MMPGAALAILHPLPPKPIYSSGIAPLPISVTCPKCSTTLKVKSELAGKRGKCPKCQGPLHIPTVEQRAPQVTAQATGERAAKVQQPPATPEERRAQVLDAFQGGIERPAVPFSYSLRLSLIAVVICLVPVLYLAMILLFAVGAIVWYLYAPSLLAGTTGVGQTILLYGPVAVGLLLSLLLLKPLVAPRPAKGKPKDLPREKAPLLFELVEKIAALMGAEHPGQVALDANNTLYRSSSRLVIGLPLVAGLSVTEVAGLIARECGFHLRGAGAGNARFIRAISSFFFRAVREKDAWDEALLAATSKRRFSLGKLLYPLRGLFWLVKVLNWPLMYLARMLSGLLLQKTHYDADLGAVRLIGSGPFAETFRTLRVIDFAWQQVQADLLFQRTENQLPDNLARQLENSIAQIPDDYRASLASQEDDSETEDFALIPAEKDRLVAAQVAAAPGIYSCPLPATVLFDDFDALAKDVTWEYYLTVFGPPLERRFLHPVK